MRRNSILFKMIALMILLVVMFAGCAVDLYSGKRPTDYNNTKWVSEDYDIWFEVNSDFHDKYGCNAVGQITINGVTTETVFLFDYGTGINVYPTTSLEYSAYGKRYRDGDAWLFLGDCRFGKKKFIISIRNNEKGFLPDDIEKITFIREDLE